MTSWLLLSTAEHAPPPLLDIDGTVGVQLLLFLVLLGLLTPLLFRPFLRLAQQREQGIDGARAEARRMEDQAAARVAGYDARMAEARLRAAAEGGALHAETGRHLALVVEQARAGAHEALEAARGRAQLEAAATRRELEAQRESLARAVATRILGRAP